MDFSLLLSSYATVWSNPEVLLMTFIGALGGVLLGAIPGMTATMGVALLIPFSFGMDLIPSIGLLLGIYCGGMYGGSISAILIHAPGTPAAAATLLDGYPMCKKGQAGKALSVAMFASFCGGVIGALVSEYFAEDTVGVGRHIRENIVKGQYPTAWAYIAVACLIGISMYAILMLAEHFILKRRKG